MKRAEYEMKKEEYWNNKFQGAQKIDRMNKTFRLRKDLIEKIEGMAKKYDVRASRIMETLIEDA